MATNGGGHITWGPQGGADEQQHFAIAGPDLKLFWDQSPDRGESKARGFAEPVENFTLVGVNQSIKNARCIAWTPAKTPARMLAAGLSNGRVLLANFHGRWSMEDCDTMELWNGTSAVNALEWHPAVPGLLAGGFNRIKREESSVLVWDVDRPEWSWLKTSEDSDLWPNPIVKSRSRGSMERLSTFAASGTIGSGSGDRLDVASGVMTGSVTHSSSGLSAGSRGSDGDRSGSDRVSGGRASSGESIDTLSASGGPLNALRRDISGSFTTSSQSSASERFTAPFGDGASVTVAMGEQEQSQSLGWLPDSPACLAVGTSLQWLRIYDIRTQKAVAKVVAHPGTPVRGVRVAPTSPHHIATFEKPDSIGGASIVKIWDHRLLQAPLLQWAVGAPLIDVAWVPTAQHDGNLATLVTGGQPSDAGAILLWSTLGATDMVQAQRGADEDSDHGIKRRNAPPAPIIPTPARIIRITGQNSPAAFAWHPKLPQSLVLAEDGQIAMMTLRPPTAVAWHGESIAVGFGAKLRSVQVAMPDSLETTMKRRVEAGYAMSARQNAEITAASGASGEHTKAARSSFDQYGVHFAWEWIEHMERLSEYNMLGKRLDAGKRGDKNDHPYHGVRQAIPKGATGAELSSEAYTLAVNGLEGIVYGGHARQRAMRLCGWEGIAGQVDFASCGLDAQAQEAQLLRLEGEGHHTRAAALAIFALDIRRAVLSLQRAVSASANASGLDRLGSDEARGEANRWLRLAALALGGYSPGRETEWGQTCVDLGILAAPRRSGTPQRLHYAQEEQDAMQGAVADPYLRAAFVFLACHATHMSSLEGASKTGTGAKTEASITPSDASSNVTEESYLNQPGSPGNVSVDSSVHRSVYSAVSQSNSVSTDGERNGSSATVGPDKGSGAGELRFLYKRSHFAPVLEVDGLTRYDTIAFACRFLEDESLASYLDSMESIVIDRGSLEGLLLLGLTEKSIPLLQAYVDATADIQTAALLLAFVSPRRFKCAEATNWMTSYRDLLDRWQLYHQRCQLDICIVPYSGVREVPPQTYATCQFCGENLTQADSRKNKGSGRGASKGLQAKSGSRIRTCPSCVKPLPRCSVCLLTMNAANPALLDTSRRPKLQLQPAKLGQQPPNDNGAAARFQDWFTWCQCCHHGGHAECLRSWFELHTMCPVSGCKCICLSKDVTLY